MEAFLGKDHIDYKKYIEQFNIVIDAIDEIAFLSNTLDYERLVVFFKEVVEIFEFFKNIDENDDNSEGFSNMTNKDDLFLSIIDCGEYNNLIKFMETYRETIIRKSDNLKEKIAGLLEFRSLVNPINGEEPNNYIKKVYDGNVELIQAKMKDISDKLKKNIDDELPVIDEKKVKFDIKLITKNDMICILSSYRFLKMFVYKHMHVIDREYYTATKEDVLEFRKELYDIYMMLCEHFNREKNLYVEDIHTKFLEVVGGAKDLIISKDDGADAKTDGADAKTDGADAKTDGADVANAAKTDEKAAKADANTEDVAATATLAAVPTLDTPVRVAAPTLDTPAPTLDTPVRVAAVPTLAAAAPLVDNDEEELRNLEERMELKNKVEATPAPALGLDSITDITDGVRGQVKARTDAARKDVEAGVEGIKNQFTSGLNIFGSLKGQLEQAATPAGLFTLASGQAQQPTLTGAQGTLPPIKGRLNARTHHPSHS
jgi:hypothetical protein